MYQRLLDCFLADQRTYRTDSLSASEGLREFERLKFSVVAGHIMMHIALTRRMLT